MQWLAPSFLVLVPILFLPLVKKCGMVKSVPVGSIQACGLSGVRGWNALRSEWRLVESFSALVTSNPFRSRMRVPCVLELPTFFFCGLSE